MLVQLKKKKFSGKNLVTKICYVEKKVFDVKLDKIQPSLPSFRFILITFFFPWQNMSVPEICANMVKKSKLLKICTRPFILSSGLKEHLYQIIKRKEKNLNRCIITTFTVTLKF